VDVKGLWHDLRLPPNMMIVGRPPAAAMLAAARHASSWGKYPALNRFGLVRAGRRLGSISGGRTIGVYRVDSLRREADSKLA
jgi:hypothetical protein